MGKFQLDEPINFDILINKAPEKWKGAYSEEPHLMDITYTTDDGDTLSEAVYEDPGEGLQRPRLLVSLQSVLSLKGLCEREFARVEVLSDMLQKCRCAYFKELIWLREQLLLAARPNQEVLVHAVNSYEVYWFDPPQYVNDELREFLQECIRQQHRKLIEENFELQMKLDGKSFADMEDPLEMLKRVVRKIGSSGKIVKMLQAVALSKDFGSREMLLDFQGAICDIAGSLGLKKEVASPTHRQEERKATPRKDDGAAEELAALRERMKRMIGEMDELKRAKEAAEKALAAETARAEAERQRADAERERADQAESSAKAKEKGAPKGNDRTFERLREAADRATERIMTCVSQLSRMRTFAGAAPSPPSSPTSGVAHLGLEQASYALETLVQVGKDPNEANAAEAMAKLQRAVENLTTKVQRLEQQLRQAQEAEKRARKEAEEALKRAEAAGAKIPTPPKASKTSEGDAQELERAGEAERAASKRAEKAEKELAKLREQLAQQQAELEGLKQEIRRLKGLLQGDKSAELGDEIEKLKQQVKELKRKVKEAEEAADLFASKLTRAQDRIAELKEEVKMWKRKCGVEVNSDDESEFEDDLPNFLISYAKRNRNSTEPRWVMLSKDAMLSKMKREFLFGQKYNIFDAASSAFHFLRASKPDPRLSGKKGRPHNMLSGGGGEDGYWQWVPAGADGMGLATMSAGNTQSTGFGATTASSWGAQSPSATGASAVARSTGPSLSAASAAATAAMGAGGPGEGAGWQLQRASPGPRSRSPSPPQDLPAGAAPLSITAAALFAGAATATPKDIASAASAAASAAAAAAAARQRSAPDLAPSTAVSAHAAALRAGSPPRDDGGIRVEGQALATPGLAAPAAPAAAAANQGPRSSPPSSAAAAPAAVAHPMVTRSLGPGAPAAAVAATPKATMHSAAAAAASAAPPATPSAAPSRSLGMSAPPKATARSVSPQSAAGPSTARSLGVAAVPKEPLRPPPSWTAPAAGAEAVAGGHAAGAQAGGAASVVCGAAPSSSSGADAGPPPPRSAARALPSAAFPSAVAGASPLSAMASMRGLSLEISTSTPKASPAHRRPPAGLDADAAEAAEAGSGGGIDAARAAAAAMAVAKVMSPSGSPAGADDRSPSPCLARRGPPTSPVSPPAAASSPLTRKMGRTQTEPRDLLSSSMRHTRTRLFSDTSTSAPSGDFDATASASASMQRTLGSGLSGSPKTSLYMPYRVSAPNIGRRSPQGGAGKEPTPPSDGHPAPPDSPMGMSPKAGRRGDTGTFGRARSVTSLPLTNGAAAMAATTGFGRQAGGRGGPASPSRRGGAAGGGRGQAVGPAIGIGGGGGVAAEEHFVEESQVLPPLPQRPIKKAPPPPSWLLPLGT